MRQARNIDGLAVISLNAAAKAIHKDPDELKRTIEFEAERIQDITNKNPGDYFKYSEGTWWITREGCHYLALRMKLYLSRYDYWSLILVFMDNGYFPNTEARVTKRLINGYAITY